MNYYNCYNYSYNNSHLCEQLQQVNVVALLPAVSPQQPVDGALQQKGIVDGVQSDTILNTSI